MSFLQAWRAKAADTVERLQSGSYSKQYSPSSSPLPMEPASTGTPQRSTPQESAVQPDAVLERLLAKARTAEVREQFLLIPQESYTEMHQVKVLAATYNVNGRAPPQNLDLSPWLSGGRYADIVAVGFQEIVPLNATNIVLGTTMDSALVWDALVADALNGGHNLASVAAPPGQGRPEQTASAAAAGAGEGAAQAEQQLGHSAAGAVDDVASGPLADAAGAAGPADGGAAALPSKESGSGEDDQQLQPSVDDLLGMAAAPEAAAVGSPHQQLGDDIDLLGLSLYAPSVAGASPPATDIAAEAVPAGAPDREEELQHAEPALPSGSSDGSAADMLSANDEEDASSGDSNPPQASDAASPDHFVQVASKQMVGVYLSVWVRRSLLPHIRGVQVVSIATGALGYFGNKGAVAVRMRVYDSSLCFINAHLSSGEAEGDELRRHYDYAEVLRRGYFPAGQELQQAYVDAQGITRVLQPGHSGGDWGTALHILDCEHLIWIGDLNYRLQGLQAPQVLAAIQKGYWESLLAADQLRLAMRSRLAFGGWTEQPITFPPTFKLRRGTSQYLGEASDTASNSSHPSSTDLAGLQEVIKDEHSSMTLTGSQAAFEAEGANGAKAATKVEKEKPRTPAWTDRILWRSSTPGGLRQLTYAAADGVTVSDHRPVSGAFFVQAREYVRDKVEAALETARRVADAKEMAAVPHCSAEPTSLNLGTLEYGEVAEHTVTLTNTAQAPSHFAFVPVPGTSQVLPGWLAANPSQGVVAVGGGASITLRACVAGGPGGAAEKVVVESKCSLDCILVLRIEGGNDVFLSLSGCFAPSCFGLGWATLAALPRPVSAPDQLQSASSLGLDVGGERFYDPLQIASQVPPELVRLTDLLRHDAWLATPGLFVKAFDLATAAAAAAVGTGPAAGAAAAAAAAGAAAARRLSRGSGSVGARSGAGGHLIARANSLDRDGDGASPAGSLRKLSPLSSCGSPRHRHGPGHGAAGLLRFDSSSGRPASPAWDGGSGFDSPQQQQQQQLEPASPLGSPPALHRQQALLAVRRALDGGRPFPEGIDAHDAAAALLAFFAELPQPLMPQEVVQVCDVYSPAASTAVQLLLESLSPAELAVLTHLLLMMMEALAPENRHGNGLSPGSLAAILAEIWFPALPPAGIPAGPLAQGRGAAPPSVAEISMRRIEFVQLLLEDGSILQTLCTAL